MHVSASGASLCRAVLVLRLTLAQWLAIAQKLPVGSVITVCPYALDRGDIGAPQGLLHCEAVGNSELAHGFRMSKGNPPMGTSFVRLRVTGRYYADLLAFFPDTLILEIWARTRNLRVLSTF